MLAGFAGLAIAMRRRRALLYRDEAALTRRVSWAWAVVALGKTLIANHWRSATTPRKQPLMSGC